MYIPHLPALLPSILQVLVPSSAHSRDDTSRKTSLVLPHHQPSFAERLDPHLAAFSIEADRWPDWAGYVVGEPNVFVRQLLENLKERTGVAPAIRVGADSEDRTHLDLSVDVGHAVFPPSSPDFPYPEAERITIGRDWYALSANLPSGTPFTWGLNLKSLNVSETVAQAAVLAETFQGRRAHLTKHVKLEWIEIGNEPDLYTREISGGGVGNPGDWSQWSPKNYSRTWSHLAKKVAKVVHLGDGTSLRVGAIALGGSASGWSPQTLVEAGLFHDKTAKKHTKVFSEHMYNAGFVVGAEAKSGELMDKGNVRGNLSLRALDVIAARKEGLKFVMGETNSYANHGSPGTSNTAESALWGIDYLLQSASMGISRVYLSHGVGYRYSSIQPISGIKDDGRGLDRAHIMPLYYAMLFVNEAIGDGKEDKYVVELGTTDPRFAAYGVYEGKRLRRVVVINTEVHFEGERRKELHVHLDGVGEGTKVKRLHVPFTSADVDVTWAGQDFDTPSGKPEGGIEVEDVHHGTVVLPASSAVLVFVK